MSGKTLMGRPTPSLCRFRRSDNYNDSRQVGLSVRGVPHAGPIQLGIIYYTGGTRMQEGTPAAGRLSRDDSDYGEIEGGPLRSILCHHTYEPEY